MAKWRLNEAVVVRWYCCHMVQNIPNFKVVITSSTSLADDSVAIEMHDSKSEDADSSSVKRQVITVEILMFGVLRVCAACNSKVMDSTPR